MTEPLGQTAQGPLIAVCGGANADPRSVDDARSAGEWIARRGGIVICGGLGGVMAAAAEGAREGGGMAIGLLPGWDAAAAAPSLTVAIPTGLEELRNALIIRAARAIVAIDGGVGTLTEIALALRLERPVTAIRSWDVRPPQGTERDRRLHVAETAVDAVDWVFSTLLNE